jgi:hypothetical protein
MSHISPPAARALRPQAALFLAQAYREVDIQGFKLYYLQRSRAVLWGKIEQISHE